MDVTFRVDHEPIGQPRPRATKRGNHAGVYELTRIKDKKTGTWRDHPIVGFRAACKLSATQVFRGQLIKGPASISLVCVFPRTKEEMRPKVSAFRMRHTKKPDNDNVLKAVQDAINGVAVADDAQFSVTSVSKWIAAKGEAPHVEVSIRSL